MIVQPTVTGGMWLLRFTWEWWGAKGAGLGKVGRGCLFLGPEHPTSQAVSSSRTDPSAGFDQRVRKGKNKGARNRQGNPGDALGSSGLTHGFNQKASGSRGVEFSAPAGKSRLRSPPPLQRASSLDYRHPPMHCHLPPRAPDRRFTPVQVLFVEGSNQCRGVGGHREGPSWEDQRGGSGGTDGSAPRRLEPSPQSPRAAASLAAAVRQHPPLLPQRGFPLLSVETLRLRLCQDYSYPSRSLK